MVRRRFRVDLYTKKNEKTVSSNVVEPRIRNSISNKDILDECIRPEMILRLPQ